MFRCPHCGSVLLPEYDGYEDYQTCMMCAREYDLDGKPRRMPQVEFKQRYGIRLTKSKALW